VNLLISQGLSVSTDEKYNDSNGNYKVFIREKSLMLW